MTTVLLYTAGVVFFVGAILVSIGLHELGHMIPAKRFGGKVTQYFIGFGPTVWSRRVGETEYGVKAIPLGGYVKIVGMLPPGAEHLVEETTYDEDGEAVHKVRRSNTGMFTQLISDARAAEWEYVKQHDTDRLFYRLAWWKKIVVMASGVMTNLVLAFVLFAVVYMGHGVPTATTTVSQVSRCVVATTVGQDTPPCTAAPPMKAAEMASSSNPSPAFGPARFRRAVNTSPASAASTPMLTNRKKSTWRVLMPDSSAAWRLPPIA